MGCGVMSVKRVAKAILAIFGIGPVLVCPASTRWWYPSHGWSGCYVHTSEGWSIVLRKCLRPSCGQVCVDDAMRLEE